MLTLDKGTSKLSPGPSSQTVLVEVEPWAQAAPEITVFAPPRMEERI
jgi:biotin/methionine sulfoxide reductase